MKIARPQLTQLLLLQAQTPVAAGFNRLIYQHPQDAELLIKVLAPSTLQRDWSRHRHFYSPARRYRHFDTFVHELREYLAARAVESRHPHHLQRVVGLVETDMGLGLVCGAARDRSGAYAADFWNAARQQPLESVQAALDDFARWLLDSPLVADDLNPANLLYAYDTAHGDHFVLVDGFGDGRAIPMKNLFGRMNKRSKQRRLQRLQRVLELSHQGTSVRWGVDA